MHLQGQCTKICTQEAWKESEDLESGKEETLHLEIQELSMYVTVSHVLFGICDDLVKTKFDTATAGRRSKKTEYTIDSFPSVFKV